MGLIPDRIRTAERAKPKPGNDKQIVNINTCDLSLTNHWLETISKRLSDTNDTIKLLIPVTPNKPRVRHTLKFFIIKITGENQMNGSMQVDQTGVWGMQFLNDNGKPVMVPTFEAVSSIPEFQVTTVIPDPPADPNDPEAWTYKVRITATGEASGQINAKGTTASGNELPAVLGLTSIPDEAESVNESFTTEEIPE